MAESAPTPGPAQDRTDRLARLVGWTLFAAVFAFLIDTYLTVARGWPGAGAALGGGEGAPLARAQAALYAAAFLLPLALVLGGPPRSLRADAARIGAVNAFIVRAGFWAVLYVGLADMALSLLRVEGFLAALAGDALATDLGRPVFRGAGVHVPLLLAGLATAAVTRGLGFIWLALLVVAAELAIVITRFVFSYEQAFQGDLVRFWYAALFLFASAHTLAEEGHVRIDVLYAGLSDRTRGAINALGTLLLGLPFAWAILLIGMGGASGIINSPLLGFEVSQSGFGMYVKYLMAGYLGFFAVTMAIQFAGYFLEAVADWRGQPGRAAARDGAPPG
jgi:TRAP-type mannitol/chloroaromatic compound transport system permease small subunit